MYVTGFVIPVPEQNREDYLKLCERAGADFRAAGALELMEAWEDNIEAGKQTDLRTAVKAEPGEKIVFSWIVWPDRDTADRAFAAMREDPGPADMPFDGKRMIYGGFVPMYTMGREG
jgi:uncharacterized protein YbaA (DUF1428 family)